MASYQAIESRLRSCEDKLDFIMKSFTMKKVERSFLDPSRVIESTMTLAQLYRDLKGYGEEVLEELVGETVQDAPESIEDTLATATASPEAGVA